MQYAEVELGLRQHRAAQGDDQSTTSGARGTGKVKRTRARDSMPAAAPAWSSSLQEPQPARLSPAPEVTGTSGGHGAGMQIEGGEEARKVDEREIRREGAWVQHRRYVTVIAYILSRGLVRQRLIRAELRKMIDYDPVEGCPKRA